AWPVGACGLTPGYASHVFWDSDTWIFPALLLLHPQRAKSLVAFRERTVDAARQRARQRGFEGAMYPWESDPENGTEQTPHAAYVLGESEIHVNADVAIAQWQYYLASHDRDWLRAHGWPAIREVARFWASRATYDAPARRYQIMHVNPWPSPTPTSRTIPLPTCRLPRLWRSRSPPREFSASGRIRSGGASRGLCTFRWPRVDSGTCPSTPP